MDSLKIKFGLNALGTPQQIATLKIVEELDDCAETGLIPAAPKKDPKEKAINTMQRPVSNNLRAVDTLMIECP